MRSRSLASFVQKVFGDEATKKQFIADPESVMAGYELTETERQAVLGRYAMMELATTGSATSKVAYGPMAGWF